MPTDSNGCYGPAIAGSRNRLTRLAASIRRDRNLCGNGGVAKGWPARLNTGMDTQMPPPVPEEVGIDYVDPYAPRPYSKIAIAGLVVSLVACVPLIPTVLGVIFGLIGIGKTGPDRLRGRGLAIGAIVVGLLVGVGQGVLGYAGYQSLRIMINAKQWLLAEMQDPHSGDTAAMQNLRKCSTAEFNKAVTEARLKEWVEAVTAKHGRLQDIKASRRNIENTPTGLTMFMEGHFAKGIAEIELLTEGQWSRLDNVAVAGDYLRPQAP